MIVTAVRALIVGTGLFGERVWRDDAPERASKPYITIVDAIATSPVMSGDGKTMYISRNLQVDLWENARDESQALRAALFGVLDGAPLNLTTGATRLKVTDGQRFFEETTNIVHHALTLETKHDRATF